MPVIHDELGKGVTEFPEVSGKRVVPVKIQEMPDVTVSTSTLPTGAATSANQTDGSQQTKIKEVNPKDATKVNESAVLAYDANLNLSTITKTISGTAYVKTLTYDANGNLSTISAWV